MSKRPEKPISYLAGQKEGPPTLDALIALTKKLTGRDPTPEEIAEARATMDASSKSASGAGTSTTPDAPAKSVRATGKRFKPGKE
jgi:hypothetical protein